MSAVPRLRGENPPLGERERSRRPSRRGGGRRGATCVQETVLLPDQAHRSHRKAPLRCGPRCSTTRSRNRRHAHWLDSVYEIMLRQREGAFVDVGINVGQTMVKVLGIDRERRYIGFDPQVGPCCFRRAVHRRERSVTPLGVAAGAVQPDGHRRVERQELRSRRPVFGDGERRAGVSPRRSSTRHQIRDDRTGR